MDQKLLLLDFDRTLFDSGRFIDQVWEQLARYGADAKAAKTQVDRFRVYVGDLYDYNFFGHLESLGLGDTQAIVDRLHADLGNENFLFADAPSALDLQKQIKTEILTYGNEPFQRFKLSFCPQLADIQTVIMTRPKGEFLRDQHLDYNVTLVDDKPLAGTLPPHVQFIQIVRTQPERIVRHDNFVSINTLTVVKELI